MLFKSTRGSSKRITAQEAIIKGLADDGGLYVPEMIPKIDGDFLSGLLPLNYQKTALKVMKLFLDDFSEEELERCIDAAYNTDSFDCDEIVPFHQLDSDTFVMELYHGPTCAFKDMALQLLPSVLVKSLEKTENKQQVAILVATSGDTGKAALEGFADVAGTKILVFYPENGVSQVQKLQMTTQRGSNVAVSSVAGNFDDAQTGVKEIFRDKEIEKKLFSEGIILSSANSINWGRLMPQIVYYFWAYTRLVSDGAVKLGDKINFSVPTGNFGNILAGWYAKKMGLPIHKLICASNKNNVLSDFIQTGEYNRNREFHTTMSPSMDILISSNLERFLYELSDNDAVLIGQWMDTLKDIGTYNIGETKREKMADEFYGDYATEEQTQDEIRCVFNENGYLMDTHTAVAMRVYNEYRKSAGETVKTVVVSTASPYKFVKDVFEAVTCGKAKEDEFTLITELEKISGTKIPKPLAGLQDLPQRHLTNTTKQNMKMTAESLLLNLPN